MATKKATKPIVTPIDQRETFVSAAKSLNDADGVSMEEKIHILYKIQQTDSRIDQIHLLRGELPLEVQDLEDEIEGLKTRMVNINAEIKNIKQAIDNFDARKVESAELVKKYEEQRDNVKNNREYESLCKEIEYQLLDQESCDKKKADAEFKLKDQKAYLDETAQFLAGREVDLESKKKELEEIISETAKEEEVLQKQKEELTSKIDERMLVAYNKVRGNAKNHLAVVTVKRGACGGCFSQIPPQRQLDITQSKKIVVCEYCGRILVNPEFDEQE
ncbi:MAG: hypothetical protein HUJ90_07455 [Bacteroidales bacterium]|nr:hypothetical protein [Bacteroidales bacterium]